MHRRPTLGDGYITIGAGTRALGRPLDDGECLGSDEPFEDGTAREAMARRAGLPVASIARSSVVCLTQPAITVRNSSLHYDAEIGALATSLAGAGVRRAVIGNADRAPVPDVSGYIRPVGLALADANGVVPGGQVDAQLLTRDPRAPFGIEADNDAYFDTFTREWKDRSVVVVEASDLVRYDAYRSSVARSARLELQRRMLEHFDDLVGRLLARVDPTRDAVMIVGPTPLGGTARLTMATLRAPGFRPGLMVSAYTRHAGLVSIVDVGPTVLDVMGIDRPSNMEGRPYEYGRRGGDFDQRLGWLITIDEAARFRDREVAPVTTFFGVAIIVLTVFAVGSLAFARLRPLRRPLEVLALMLLGFLPAAYLARLFPFQDWGWLAYWAFLFGVAIILGLGVWLATNRNGITTLIAMLSIVTGVIAVDVLTGAHLQFNSTLGYSPTVAGRYAGIGNLAYAQLSAGTLLLAGLVAARVAGRRGVGIAIALMLGAFVIDGAPIFGADVGGVLSMVPAYALTATMLLGWRVRWRLVALYGGATLLLIGLFAAFDASRPETQQTHLGRLVHTTTDGGWGAFTTVIHRKIDANFAVTFHSTWTVTLPVALLGAGYLLYAAPGGLRALARACAAHPRRARGTRGARGPGLRAQRLRNRRARDDARGHRPRARRPRGAQRAGVRRAGGHGSRRRRRTPAGARALVSTL